mmetsp:Transcript_21909/g.72382  ORF Transcript_21909/g.72382 Transcript_21909/m.72382 type:complete len:106 (-) Transcript_21909:582-899(-)
MGSELCDSEYLPLFDIVKAEIPTPSQVSPNGTSPRDDFNVKRTWYVTAKKPLPPAKAHEKMKNKILEFWEKARPWALKALDIAHKLFTNGFQIRIPIPDFLNPRI